jgi:hypothetical protein
LNAANCRAMRSGPFPGPDATPTRDRIALPSVSIVAPLFASLTSGVGPEVSPNTRLRARALSQSARGSQRQVPEAVGSSSHLTPRWREPDSNSRSHRDGTAVGGRPTGQCRRGPYLKWLRLSTNGDAEVTFRPKRPQPAFLMRADVPIGNAQQSLSQQRDRWFESGSLQRRVTCEPDFLDQAARDLRRCVRLVPQRSTRVRSGQGCGPGLGDGSNPSLAAHCISNAPLTRIQFSPCLRGHRTARSPFGPICLWIDI